MTSPKILRVKFTKKTFMPITQFHAMEKLYLYENLQIIYKKSLISTYLLFILVHQDNIVYFDMSQIKLQVVKIHI